MQRLRHFGHRAQQMLGIVERQQHFERLDHAGEPLERTVAARLEAERCRDGPGDGGRIDEATEPDPAHAVPVLPLAVREQVLGNQGLADAARADDRDEPMLLDQLAQRGQIIVAPEQADERGR
ncbi:MAG TPA: hypothetical protein VLU41_04550 [Ideonella sp.]|nr:hypothetical protein [Ideonella sp.]